ncbi:RES family NAD+ phosphorylase [Gordonia sp. HY285]|uniref:RES family NAD+ phosphorylase n=1 Tax=Gordonia liuliyuniae TaxID=2911517 RepID=UPI001F34B238|nr:RES family NAD+ phosphorylase [Gordonia liuliyuniae]MCF8609690.1 RES family NAD+ phosphorylase [Gordonia liuliyuniae]
MTEYLPPPDPSRFPDLEEGHVRTVDVGVRVGRIYFAGGDFPTTWDGFRWFGPTNSRFDHYRQPAGVHADRAIMYLGAAILDACGRPNNVLQTALVECFRDAGDIDLRHGLPHFVLFNPVRPLRLLDLTDSDWITAAGGNAAIPSGPRHSARVWATAIYEHYTGADAVDGLIYGSSNKPANRAIALWERGADALPDRPVFHEPLSHLGLRAAIETFAGNVGLGVLT